MHILIITNAFITFDSVKHQVARLSEAFNKAGARVSVLSSASLPAHLSDGDAVVSLPPCDAVVYLDKDKHFSHALERGGVRLFNSARAIELCDDKMMTYIALAGQGIAMPRTVSAPLCYIESPDDAFLPRVAELVGFPVVVKENYGSMGRQVHLAKDMTELKAIHAKLKHVPHIFQEFIAESSGRDLRVIVIGGKAVAAMMRKSDTDFRSNIELGGKAYAITPDPEYIAAAERAAALLGLDYCGVDILFGKDKPILCEVNSNAFFRGTEQVTGVDVAGLYANYIIEKGKE